MARSLGSLRCRRCGSRVSLENIEANDADILKMGGQAERARYVRESIQWRNDEAFRARADPAQTGKGRNVRARRFERIVTVDKGEQDGHSATARF